MTDTCPGCHGTGKITVDCPSCRNTEPFEHEDLASGICFCCNGQGHIEDLCPLCKGTGIILEREHILKV